VTVINRSRDHSIPHRPFSIGIVLSKDYTNRRWSLGTKPLSLTVSKIFNGECDTMVNMTLNVLYAKVKVIHFGTNRFVIYDFL